LKISLPHEFHKYLISISHLILIRLGQRQLNPIIKNQPNQQSFLIRQAALFMMAVYFFLPLFAGSQLDFILKILLWFLLLRHIRCIRPISPYQRHSKQYGRHS